MTLNKKGVDKKKLESRFQNIFLGLDFLNIFWKFENSFSKYIFRFWKSYIIKWLIDPNVKRRLIKINFLKNKNKLKFMKK